MALIVSSRGRSEQLKLQAMSKKYEDTQISPERTKIWTEPDSKRELRNNGERRSAAVPVIYYLCRNGQLDHPHFMEVSLSSSQGLFLTDVINRLNSLRGKGMANHYSWSAKRSYKNGYVWHDLEENDFICPVRGQEYILKGSEILESSTTLTSKLSGTASSSTSVKKPEIMARSDDVEPDFPLRNRRKNQSWSSVDFNAATAGAPTQTEEKRRRRKQVLEKDPVEEDEAAKIKEEQMTELSREEISPPPSDSSPETLESLMNADGALALSSSSSIKTVDRHTDPTAAEHVASGGKIKPSSILMSLISCGSVSFREGGAAAVKGDGLSLISQYKHGSNGGESIGGLRYFSGSLIENKEGEQI